MRQGRKGLTLSDRAVEPAPVRRLAAIDAAIIDLDGTMVDTLPDFDVALNRTLAELHLPGIERARIAQMVGKGSEHLIASVLETVLGSKDMRNDEPATLFDSAWTGYQRHYAAVNGRHSTIYPGVREGLENFRARGWQLACLTNKPLAFAQSLLATLGLDGYFEVVFGGDSFDRKKPDPLPLLKTCEALGSAPSRTLMVGDSSNDARAARAAGCPVWLVTYGYNHGMPIREVDADGFIDSLVDL